MGCSLRALRHIANKLAAEDEQLTSKLDTFKADIIQQKNERIKLITEKEELAEKAGMIANTVLLGDFKCTKEDFEKMVSENEKLNTKLKNYFFS